MSELNETATSFICIVSVTSLAYTVHHTYRFDKWRCLVPKRKEWFRVLLTWMLIMCQVCMFVWGAGWCYVKYKLGWVTLPGYGALPYPATLFVAPYTHYNKPLTWMLNIAYSLQASLNAEEGLYWYHLMRAVRKPSSAGSWLGSYFFYAWIAISIVTTVAQCTVGWIHNTDPNVQLARELTCGGAIELLVLGSASVALFHFPRFLRDVKASGAGPDVRSRLHFYHEANKVRTFLRLIFVATTFILGIDGLTPEMKINSTPMASDILIQICVGSFFMVIVVSVMLYLPRNYGVNGAKRAQVFVGRQPGAAHAAASGFALMSLLREGGQWDDEDDVRAGNLHEEPGKKWSLGARFDKWDDKDIEAQAELPAVLEHFTSPFDVPTQDQRPTEIRIHVAQEVHEDRGDHEA